MIELLFVACLQTSPLECQERSIIYTDISPDACLSNAPPELAKWAADHPKWMIARWKCAIVGVVQDA